MLISACGGTTPSADSITKACGSGDVVSGRPLRIVSTVAPITSIIANVAGGSGAVITGLVPEGTNSHTFEPSLSAARFLEESDVVFTNGLGLEEPTKDLAAANINSGAEVCEIATESLPESEWIYDFSFPKEGGKPNPHLWTNPPMVKEYARLVRDTLVKRNPENAEVFKTNFTAFAAKVDVLDAAMRTATETIPVADRKLLTYHDAFAYFSRHYEWTVVGAIQPSSFEEPTPKEIANLITQVKEEKVKAVFGSEVFPSPVLEQIGKETDAQYIDVLRDDDLLGNPGDPEHSWMGLMRFDFVTMVEALGGDASALKALDVSDVVKDSAVYPQ
ncbi:MAG: zinc ABC transporter substrate-binding protein [Ilumatobacteraceae bacterium]|nr:zinc ABC transporter substrate-binding protein [Ilumatobacteraceae bacterium]